MFDILIENGTIVPMDGTLRTLRNSSIGIIDGKIAAIGPYRKLREVGYAEVIDATDRIVIPGLINNHTHLFQTLSKGLGHDSQLFDWFRRAILPTAEVLNEEDCYVAALLGCVEAVKSGVTCVNDFMYVHPRPRLSDAVIKAMAEVGVRGILSRGIVDDGRSHGMPDSLIEDTDSAAEDCERLATTYQNRRNGLIHIWFAPASLWMSSPRAFKKAKELSDKYQTWCTWHASETTGVVEDCVKRFGKSDFKLLKEIGFLNSKRLAVHCVWLDDQDISIIKYCNVKVAHCPVANMYLSDGIASIPQMLDQGITVGLGTDGAASNNNQDMIFLLKTTALLHKVATRNPTSITAEKVLELATIGGAKSIGLEGEIGSIEIGKKADLVIINEKAPNMVPSYDPASSLVYNATQENVDTVLIEGKPIMRNRRLTTIDESSLLDRVAKIVESLKVRADLPK